MNRTPLLRFLCCLFALAMLAACGTNIAEKAMEKAIEDETGGSADVDVRADGSMEVTTEEGTFQTGNSMPEDWPKDVPVYAGATVQFSGTASPENGQRGSAVVLVTADSATDVAAFYKETLKENGWTVQSTMEAQGTIIFSAEKDDRVFSFLTTTAEGMTTITMGVAKK